MLEPRKIYIGSMSRREASWGRSRRRTVPAWALIALALLTLAGLMAPLLAALAS